MESGSVGASTPEQQALAHQALLTTIGRVAAFDVAAKTALLPLSHYPQLSLLARLQA